MNTVLYPTQSSYISYGSQGSNYNGENHLRAGVQSDTGTRYYSLLQFDISGIPSHSIINSANMSLWSYDDGSTWKASTTQLAKRVTNAWTASRLTYSNFPGADSSDQASMTNGGYNEWYTWDIKTIAQNWVNNAYPNYGIEILQSNTTTCLGKCYGKSGNYTPKLEIDYTPVGMKVNNGGVWRQGLAYSNVGGTWRLTQVFGNSSGAWRQSC